MRSIVLRGPFFLALLLAGLFLSRSQQVAPTLASLAQQYSEAQADYDSATVAGRRRNSGPDAEERFNASALRKFQRLYPLLPSNSRFDSLRFYTAFKVGELQHYFENFSEAVHFYNTALAVKKQGRFADSVFFKPYLYAGIIYYTQNKFDSALQYFTIAESIQKKYNNALPEGERLYNIVGVLYYERGNYRQARNYFQKAIEVLRPDNEAYDNLYVNYHINLAQILLKLEEYNEANTIYQKLLPLHIMTREIYHNLGSLNLSLGAAEKALFFFRKVGPGYNKAIRLYNSMGDAFFSEQQYDSATTYYNKALQTYQSLGKNSDPIGYGLTLKSLGRSAVRFGRYNDALQLYQEAIQQFYPSFTSPDIHRNPVQFSGVFSYINLFQALVAKADAWHFVYTQTDSLAAAKEELATYQSAFRLIAYVEGTYESDEARLFLSKIRSTLHVKPIAIAYELYRRTKNKGFLEDLYLFDQQNKATALVLSRQLSEELGRSHSPLLQKEQELKSAITLSSIRAAQVTDSAQLVALNQGIRDKEIQLSKVQDEVNRQTAGKETSIPSIAILQKELLDKKTAMVSYHLSDSLLTILTIRQDSVGCVQRRLPDHFAEDFSSYLRYLKDPDMTQVQPSSNGLFSLLFDGVPLQGIKELILIPDDVLNYLPFESLKNRAGHFLVEDMAVQYQYSSALLKKEKNTLEHAAVLSFAPFSRQADQGFSQLPHSREEVTGLQGQQFFDTAATKARFLQQCGSYKLVHLATHAVVNSEKDNLSYIAFSPRTGDHLLYAQEIYNLPLQHTQLVILSACETGSGQLVKGEGVMSLSRAFRYAGCANVVTTLWKAHDFSTAYLTTRIHHHLDEGLSISQAVQWAKKDYLGDRSVHPRLKHPFYWSHLVFIGNVQEERGLFWPWPVAAAAVLALSGWLLFRFRKKKVIRL